MENKLKLVYNDKDEKMVENDVMKRSNKIKKILDESRDLNQLSEEISMLVLQQQPDIDTIETLVENSTFYIKESAKEIKDAAIIKNNFKSSGKKILVYSEKGISNSDYYLISMADEIYTHRMANVDLRGFNILYKKDILIQVLERIKVLIIINIF